jgi:anti-sigma regulatory factor (Ser/Thr protein kinase)
MIEPSVLAAFMGAHSPRQVWTLPGLPESVREARSLARASAATPYQAEAAALCVSELVTNALLHSLSGRPGGEVTVVIEPGAEAGELRISVGSGPALVPAGPWFTPPATDGPTVPEHGYGLAVVDAVAAAWGYSPFPGHPGGRFTWCEIPEAAL